MKMSQRNQKKGERKFSEKSRREKIEFVLYWLVYLSFAIPIAYLVIKLISDSTAESDAGYHSRADYVLMIVECLLGLFVIHIPAFLEKKLKFEIPVILYSMYLVFLYCAIFLGEVRSFYYVIPFWDSILHTFSSLMLGTFGFMLVSLINRNEKLMLSMSPKFIALFAFCFALSVGALWEIYEFTFDGLLGLNMQKFITADGTILAGHEALADTMKDIILDACGALVSSLAGYFITKKDRFWIMPKLH